MQSSRSDGIGSEEAAMCSTFECLWQAAGSSCRLPSLLIHTLPAPTNMLPTQPATPPPSHAAYWKLHPETWPVQALALGSTSYNKTELLRILGQQSPAPLRNTLCRMVGAQSTPPTSGRLLSRLASAVCPPASNGIVPLAQQLISAKLNRLQPAPRGASAPADVAEAMAQADALIGSLVVPPLGSGSLAAATTSALVAKLAAFNQGELAPLGGPGRCSIKPYLP
ncbi:hypothetical protein ABPG75_010308 [Micractinium tetrahymenae]